MDKPQLYIGLDTQDVEWNLVCGTRIETIWTGSLPAHDEDAFTRAIESARIQCGFTADGYQAVALYEDLPWEAPVWEFLDGIGVEAHILDPTGVPPVLGGMLDDEGLYKAPTLFEMLVRYFGWGETNALRTLPYDHAFVDELDYPRKERIRLRKEYRRHLNRLRSLISRAGCKVPKNPNTCVFSTLTRRDGNNIARHYLARLERHRARAELVADQHAVAEDEFRDYCQANAEALNTTPEPHPDDPIDMQKASRKLALTPNPKRLFQTTPAEVLYPALKEERKALAREMTQHRNRIRDWVRRQDGDASPDLHEQDPATFRTGDGDRLPRTLVMLLRRVRERYELAARQHVDLAAQLDRFS